MADSNYDKHVAMADWYYRSKIDGVNMFCPRCQRQTTHADIGDNQVQCVVCQSVEQQHPRKPKFDKMLAVKDDSPYFDRKLAASGEKRNEYEA